jgi:hypothetical protein
MATTLSSPPFNPKDSTPPNPLLRYRFAISCDGCDSSPGYDTHATRSCLSNQRASASALLTCRSTRRLSVSSPWMSWKAPKGLRHDPRSRRISTRTRMAKEMGPKVSQNLRPW